MFRKILVANDGSPGGQAALSGAIDLALQCGSELHMICIEEIPRFAATIDEIEEEKEEADLRFTSVIRRAKELAAQKGVSLETHLLAGHPVPSIVEFLRAGTFDLWWSASWGIRPFTTGSLAAPPTVSSITPPALFS